MTSDLNILCCPKCGGVHLAVSVETWADFVGGSPDHFDEEDIHSVIPLEGHPAICRSCQHQWTIAGRFTQHCRECGEPMFITSAGIAHHGQPNAIDHDADDGHVALTDNPL